MRSIIIGLLFKNIESPGKETVEGNLVLFVLSSSVRLPLTITFRSSPATLVMLNAPFGYLFTLKKSPSLPSTVP
ncbi:MAG: hypothetical protein ACI9KI_000813 [Patiriisocius sp.]|jgi:hypothetical protein